MLLTQGALLPFSILFGITSLPSTQATTVSVEATDLHELADKLYLDYDCVRQPAGSDALEPGLQLLIPLACCKGSCQGAFCGQRTECNGDSAAARPTQSGAPSPLVVITGTRSATESATVNEPSGPVLTLTTKISDGETLTLPIGTSFTQTSTITTEGLTLTLDPSSTGFSVPSGTSDDGAATASGNSRPAIVVEGSEIPIPASATTISEPDGLLLTIGSSNIQADGTTIDLPFSNTILSAPGVTLTLTEEAASQQEPAGPASTDPDKPSSGNPASITDPPASDPAPTTSAAATRSIPGPGIAITLDSQSYILPATGSVELLQPDGSRVTLFPESIASGSQTISVDASATQAGVTLGDLTFGTGPAQEGSPSLSGGGGLDGLVDTLDGLSGSASSIISTFDEINDLGVQWAEGGLSNSDFSASVSGLFDDVVSSLSRFESNLRSTLRQYAGPSKQLTEDGWRRVSEAYATSTEQLDIAANLRKLISRITTLKNRPLSDLEQYWVPGAIVAGAITSQAQTGLILFGNYDWSRERRQTTLTTSTKSAEAFRPTRRRKSTTTTAAATAVPYLLSSKIDTDPMVFGDYIKSIDPEGEPWEDQYPDVPWQSHITNLTVEQAKKAEKQPFMYFVDMVTEPPEEPDDDFPISSQRMLHRRAVEDLVTREDADAHLRILSAQNHRELTRVFGDSFARDGLPPYIYDPIGGKGQTIYVVDDGFNPAHSDLRGTADRVVSTRFAPNRLTLPLVPLPHQAPNDIQSHTGHGTHVASVAAGLRFGVAPKANLVLVKHKNAASNEGGSGKFTNRRVTPAAADDTWSWIIQNVADSRNGGNNGKFIVNLSTGLEATPVRKQILTRAMQLCWEKDIITTVAAGNDGQLGSGSLSYYTPQEMGTPDNALITVGGVYANGVLWEHSNFERPSGVNHANGRGSLSVFTLSVQVLAAGFASNTAAERRDGTSEAAPAVAGLAAYFASLESLANEFPTGNVAKSMKDYIIQYAFRRNDNPIHADAQHPPPPERIIVPYNQAPEGLCSSDRPNKRSLQNVTESSLATRQDDSEFDVVVDGEVVAPNFSKSYCAVPTATTSTKPTSSAMHPHMRHEDPQRRSSAFLGLDEMADARDAFCEKMKKFDPPIKFEPGTPDYRQLIFTPQNNIYHKIRVSANWTAGANSDCEEFHFSSKNGQIGGKKPEKVCQERVDVPIQNCDTVRGQNDFWKQGGKFFRNCITWEITATYDG